MSAQFFLGQLLSKLSLLIRPCIPSAPRAQGALTRSSDPLAIYEESIAAKLVRVVSDLCRCFIIIFLSDRIKV